MELLDPMAPNLPELTKRLGKRPEAAQEVVRQFTWEIRSINVCLDDLRCFQANALGVTGPQMMILMALTDLERDDGVPVNVVAKLMKVGPPFITRNSKQLESKRFLRRTPGTKDARVVHLSLTENARKRLASIAPQQEELDQFVFDYLGIQEFARLASCLRGLRHRLEKARLHAELKS
ncbi:MarR family winged helix-turn-helix transcriptional regulator [Bradyrhizobium sp. 1AS20L]